MADSAETMREAIKRFHRNCCYPEAFDFEVDGLMNELAARGASGTKSDGGVEGHAAVPLETPTQRSGESRDPLGDGSVKVGPHREDAAGIKPGPSDPIPSQPDEREVASARKPMHLSVPPTSSPCSQSGEV